MERYDFYRMICIGTGLNYIGKTREIKKRPGNHKSNCYNKNHNSYNQKRYKYIRGNNIKWNDIIFEIIDTIYCSKEQARAREAELITFYDSIENGQNEKMPSELTIEEWNKQYKKQYRENNHEHILELQKKWRKDNPDNNKQYYKENKERLNQRHKEYNIQKISCSICNKLISRVNIKRHKKIHNK